MKRMVHLGVGIPCSTGLWQAQFGMSLVNLTTAFMRNPVPGYERQQISVLTSRTSLLPKARTELVKMAMAAGCTHLLFIDTDQTFPAWTAHALLSRKHDVVAANVVVKSIPSAPTARNKGTWYGGDKVFTLPDSAGEQQVWRIGTGVLLVNLEVFNKIEKPWFGNRWANYLDEEGNEQEDLVGEDWWFMEKLEQAGIPVYVDHDVSKHVGHIGQFEYTHSLIWAEEAQKMLMDAPAKEVA